MRSREPLNISVSRLLQRGPLRDLTARVVELAGSPTLQQISDQSSLLTTSPTDAAQAILRDQFDFEGEYAQVRDRVTAEADKARPEYPDFFVIEDGTAFLLYMLVRQAQPNLTVEIGVADGRSTQTILSALDANNRGRLVSVDINSNVGGAAVGHPRWDLRLRSPGHASAQQLRQLLEDTGPPDLFFHDASHVYHDQYTDYLVAMQAMRPGGLFVSDDVDQSSAFLHLAKNFDLKPVVVIDRRKAVGAFVRPHFVRDAPDEPGRV